MKKFLLFALICVSAVLTAKTINCEGTYSGHLQGIDSDLGNAGQDLAVVEFDGNAYAKTAEHGVDHLYEFNLVEQ